MWRVLSEVCAALGLDPGEITPGCEVVHHTGKSLVIAMKMALAEGDPYGGGASRLRVRCAR